MARSRHFCAVVALTLASSLIVASCGDDAEPTRADAGTPTTRRSSTSAGGSEALSSTSTSTSTTTTPLEDTIDLADAPPVLFVGDNDANYFEDLLEKSVVRVGPLAQYQSYLISPDAKMYALASPGDAVRPSRIELISIKTGKAVSSFDVDADRVTLSEWSPDSTAVVARGANDWITYRTDGSSQPVEGSTGSVPGWATGDSLTSAVECSQCSRFQLIDSDDHPVLVVVGLSGDGPEAGIYDPDDATIVPFEGEWATARVQAAECTRFTVLTASIDGESVQALYDVDTGAIHTIEPVRGGSDCPVPSHDGRKVALAMQAGGTVVVDAATGSPVLVARQGAPLAWSADGDELLVQGNGTFVVASDGSGGKEASVKIRAFCEVGAAGKVLAEVTGATQADSGLVLYDISRNSATKIGEASLGRTCDVSKDGGWVVTGTTIVDLEEAAFTQLTRVDSKGSYIRGEPIFPDRSARSPRVVAGG